MEQKNGMSLVVNVTQDWGIGRENQLLVSLPGDLRRFRQLTIGKTVILGRRTLATFPGGRPLPGRENFILSRDPAFQVPGARVFSDLPGAAAGGPGAAGRQPVRHRRRQCLCGAAGLLQHGLCDENVSLPPGGPVLPGP